MYHLSLSLPAFIYRPRASRSLGPCDPRIIGIHLFSMNKNKILPALVAVLTGISLPARLRAECWKYHVDHVFPCAVSIIPATVKTADSDNCPAKKELKPQFPQYVCDYIGVDGEDYSAAIEAEQQGMDKDSLKRLGVKINDEPRPASQNVREFNKSAFSDQEDVLRFSRQAYADYRSALSKFLKRTNPRWIQNHPLKVQLAMVSRDIAFYYLEIHLTHVLRPFLGKEIVAKYFSNAKEGVRQNTWHWKPYLKPIQNRETELQKIRNQATQTYLRQKRSEIAKELGTKYGAKFDANYDASEAAVDLRYPKKELNPLILKQTSHIVIKASLVTVKTPPSPAFLPNNIDEIGKRNYFRRTFSFDLKDPKHKTVNTGVLSMGLDRISKEAKVAIWHALGLTQTVGNPEQKVPLVFEQYNGTCGIAALTQYMRAHGQKVTVQELSRLSRDRGLSYFGGDNPSAWGGTPQENTGRAAKFYGDSVNGSFWMQFLQGSKNGKPNPDPYYDPYLRRFQSGDQKRLENAIRSHQGAIVTVSSNILWGAAGYPGPAGPDHDVYVTGEEVNKATHKIIGYYINDSGTGEGGRFVDAKTFLRAWIYGGDEIATISPIQGLAQQSAR